MLFIQYIILSGFIISTESTYQTIEANIKITKKIPIPFLVDGLTVELFLPENFTNGINIQKIENFKTGSILGGQHTGQIVTDKYGNRKLKIQIKNPMHEVFIDYGFSFSSRLKPIRNQIASTYPLSPKRLLNLGLYLQFTQKVQQGNLEMISISRELAKTETQQEKVVLKIIDWVQKNIVHDPSAGYDDAFTTFLNKKGNENGLKNLVLSLMRNVRIPCRMVKGISIDKRFHYRLGSQFLEMTYPKGFYSWIEIYFPTRSWTPFDLNSSFFIIPDNFVRLGVGADTEEIHDKHVFSNGFIPQSADNFFFENVKKNDTGEIRYINSASNRIIFFPPGEEGNYFSSLNPQQENADKHFYNGVFLVPQETDIYRLLHYDLPDKRRAGYQSIVNLKVTKNSYYAQAVYLDRPFFLDSIGIPLHLSGIYPANVFVELFMDENGTPKTLYARSYSRTIRENAEGFTMQRFFFQRNRLPFIVKGKYWIIVKTDDVGQLFWQGIFGNIFGNNQDTRRFSGNNWDTICHLDFLLEIWGNYFKRPQQ